MVSKRRGLAVARWTLAIVIAGTALPAELSAEPRKGGDSQSPYCRGTYSEDLVVAAPQVRGIEETTRYTFCVRSTAVYQCAYYGPDGSLMTRRQSRTAHGTAFAFRREGSSTYFLTAEHVTEWPFVTEKSETVEGIAPGCKRVSQTVSIVDDDNDSYGKDDVGMQRVVVDPALDVTILRAPIRVDAIPFTLGQNASLQVGDAIRVRGFPLGAFQAVHTGRVISAREPDDEGKWEHWDFVTDAQLSTGNSGSPALAVSCKTRGYELVGMYHAGYKQGQALNAVVGIDEFRDLMTTLRPRQRQPVWGKLGSVDRQELLSRLRQGSITPFFPIGSLTVGVRQVDGRLLYDLYSRRFPLEDWRLAIVEDLPASGFGRIGRIWFGNEQGLSEQVFSSLKPGEQSTVANLVDAIRVLQKQVLQLRQLQPLAPRSRYYHQRQQSLEREMGRGQAAHQALVRALVDLAAQHAPAPDQQGLPLNVTTVPAGAAPAKLGAPGPGQRPASQPAPKARPGPPPPQPRPSTSAPRPSLPAPDRPRELQD